MSMIAAVLDDPDEYLQAATDLLALRRSDDTAVVSSPTPRAV